MNCPSRTDEPPEDAGWNQNPPGLAADITTRQDLNGIVNLRTGQDSSKESDDPRKEVEVDGCNEYHKLPESPATSSPEDRSCVKKSNASVPDEYVLSSPAYTSLSSTAKSNRESHCARGSINPLRIAASVLTKFSKFVGPGFMISVAYIDPGNYSTDVAAGAATKFKLLFIVLMANVFAIVLQSLAVRLGTVTGLNLAEHCRANLPPWLNIVLYIMGEAAIIATDIAEVIGSAIALNLLLKIPLVAGCAITLVDVLIILIFYNPNGSMRRLRAFELFVMALVLGVAICFCIQLSLIKNTFVGDVFLGYLPSSAIVKGQGIFLSCGILGATVMPHSLYLGSGMVQSRLREFDTLAGNIPPPSHPTPGSKTIYRPTLAAIHSCLHYSVAEVALSLFTFALFVNSAILIVAGASLSSNPSASTADLFSVHALLSSTLAPVAGTVFALALLFSGTSAGIVCTIAGQMLSEGALNWTIAPWMRRLLTRSISITPSIIIAGAVGKEGLSAALNGTQVALSVVLPFVSAPLIYFTCRSKYMVVGSRASVARGANGGSRESQRIGSGDVEEADGEGEGEEMEQEVEKVTMRNHWAVSLLAVLIWLVIAVMNVSLLVLVGLGKA